MNLLDRVQPSLFYRIAVPSLEEGRRPALTPEEQEREDNRKADRDYLKWLNGYSDPYNEAHQLDLHGPGGETEGAAADVTEEQATAMLDGWLADTIGDPLAEGWKDKFSEKWGGGTPSEDEKLFKEFGHALDSWTYDFFEGNLPKKVKGWLASKPQAKHYKRAIEEMKAAEAAVVAAAKDTAKAAGASDAEAAAAGTAAAAEAKPKPKKKFAPSAYQQAIFDWVKDATDKPSGALVVDAKAGAGKSTTMEEALAFIPKNQKAVFLAFNRDIADALAKRVKDQPNVEASTINAYGRASVVKAFSKGGTPPELVKNKNRLLCEPLLAAFAQSASGKNKGKIGGDYERTYAYDMGEAITKRKMMGTLTETGGMQFPSWDAVLARFEIDLPASSKQTDQRLTKKQLHDTLEASFQQSVDNTTTMEYADQILWPVMHDLPIISRATKKKANLSWAMVDEVQDLAPLERDFVKRLAPRHVLVGDPNQSIYAFKGSDPDSMEKMQEQLGADEKPLSICYRCPQAVISLAQNIVPGIEAAPNAPQGEVASIKYEQFYDTLKPGDFVLCSMNAPNITAALSLLAQGKKATVVGRDIGKTLANLVSKIGGKVGHKKMPIDEFAVKVEKWHTKEVKRLTAEKKEHLIQGLDDKRDCLQALMEKGDVEFAGDLRKVIDDLFVNDPSPAINFSSVHKAKGLEADNVFIQRPDLMPMPMAMKSGDPIQIQQAYNLGYVAITRAKKKLTLVAPPPKEEGEVSVPVNPTQWAAAMGGGAGPAPAPAKKKATKKKAKKTLSGLKKKKKKKKKNLSSILDLINDPSTDTDWESVDWSRSGPPRRRLKLLAAATSVLPRRALKSNLSRSR